MQNKDCLESEKKKKRPTKEIAKENDAKTPNLQTKKLKKKEDKYIYIYISHILQVQNKSIHMMKTIISH